MNNFMLGIESIARGLSFSIRELILFDLFQGFILGFLLATFVYAFLVSESVKKLPSFLARDPSKGFEKLYNKGDEGYYQVSYSRYRKIVLRAKVMFYVIVAIFLLIVFVSLLRF